MLRNQKTSQNSATPHQKGAVKKTIPNIKNKSNEGVLKANFGILPCCWVILREKNDRRISRQAQCSLGDSSPLAQNDKKYNLKKHLQNRKLLVLQVFFVRKMYMLGTFVFLHPFIKFILFLWILHSTGRNNTSCHLPSYRCEPAHSSWRPCVSTRWCLLA